jgi:hypothetical protein
MKYQLFSAACAVIISTAAASQDALFRNGFEPRRFCNLTDGQTVCPGFSRASPTISLQAGEQRIVS